MYKYKRTHPGVYSLLALLALLFFYSDNLAQVDQPYRYEREYKNNEEYYSVISLNEEGLALVRQKNKYDGNKKLTEVIVLDTTLKERSVIEFYVEERYPMIGYEVTPGRLYLLYRTGESSRNNLVLFDIELKSTDAPIKFEIKPELDLKITHFSKVGSSFVLGGYVSNDPAILLYNLTDKNIKVVPGFFIKDTELVDVRVNQNQTFNVTMIDRSNRGERKIIFKTFDESGKMLLEDIVNVHEDRALQSSLSSTLQREELMVMGTWGDRQGKQSSGFFALPIDPFSDQEIRYFHFGELQHFVDYLNEKRAERIKANTKEDLQSGRTPSFTSYVVPYKIIETNEGYLLLAEVYNPVSGASPYYSTPYGNPYYTNPYNYYNPFWPGYYPGMRYRPYPYGPNMKNNEQIKTYETVVAAFDSKGNLKWDQSYKLEEAEKAALEQVGDVYYSKDRVWLVYKKESEIKVKAVGVNDEDEKTEITEKVRLKEKADEIRHEKKSEDGIRHWTGNSFYAWGYQTIRNNERKDERVREVFYVNKVVVR